MRYALLAALLFCSFGCATSYEKVRAQSTSHTSVGMGVVDPEGVLAPGEAEAAVTEVLSWWQARYPTHTGALRSYFARGAIIVSPGVGPLPATLEQSGNGGLNRDNFVAVRWERDKPNGGRFEGWLKHELSHVAIGALRWDGVKFPRDDHDAMTALGCPWD